MFLCKIDLWYTFHLTSKHYSRLISFLDSLVLWVFCWKEMCLKRSLYRKTSSISQIGFIKISQFTNSCDFWWLSLLTKTSQHIIYQILISIVLRKPTNSFTMSMDHFWMATMVLSYFMWNNSYSWATCITSHIACAFLQLKTQ